MPFLVPLVGILGGIGGTIAAGSAAVGAGLAIDAAVSKPKVPAIPDAATANAQTQSAAAQAAEALKAQARKAGGRQSTILTSPLGVTGTASVTPTQKTLLGS